MKVVFSILMTSLLISCQSTTVVQSLCEGINKDLTGLAGDYILEIDTSGSTKKINVDINRTSEGSYDLIFKAPNSPAETLPIVTCKINATEVLELVSVNSKETAIFTLLRNGADLTITSIIMDQVALSQAGIGYEVSTNPDGPFRMEVLAIDNSGIDPARVINAKAPIGNSNPVSMILRQR